MILYYLFKLWYKCICWIDNKLIVNWNFRGIEFKIIKEVFLLNGYGVS